MAQEIKSPTSFSSVDEAVESLKLDNAKKWVDHIGSLCYENWSFDGKTEVCYIPYFFNGRIVKIVDIKSN